jgi:hypothetical protein
MKLICSVLDCSLFHALLASFALPVLLCKYYTAHAVLTHHHHQFHHKVLHYSPACLHGDLLDSVNLTMPVPGRMSGLFAVRKAGTRLASASDMPSSRIPRLSIIQRLLLFSFYFSTRSFCFGTRHFALFCIAYIALFCFVLFSLAFFGL